MQTGTGIPLNAFSWAFPEPDNVGVTVVNNTAGTLFGRSRGPRHRVVTGNMAVEGTASMHATDEVAMLNKAAMQAGASPILTL